MSCVALYALVFVYSTVFVTWLLSLLFANGRDRFIKVFPEGLNSRASLMLVVHFLLLPHDVVLVVLLRYELLLVDAFEHSVCRLLRTATSLGYLLHLGCVGLRGPLLGGVLGEGVVCACAREGVRIARLLD